MMTGVSTLALVVAAADFVHARSLNGGGGGDAISAPNIASDAATQAAARAAAAARQTQDSLARAARAVQDIQAVQAAARAAAAAAQTSAGAPVAVPNGLGAGGLLPNMPAGWSGAHAPTQGVDGAGQTEVNIRQFTQQAILNWQSFNVGAHTTLTFDQQGNGSWVALNRVTNATAPSQILGNIKADGHVYVINQSGIIFGGNSQVNVGALIASTAGITDAQFTANGIYSTQSGGNFAPSFTAAGGKVVVEAGATIATRAPASVTSGGGYVLMIGSQVENTGTIATPKGQTLLAAGDDFILRRGLGTDANTSSTTRGHELSPVIGVGSTNGMVRNNGLIFAQQGDITLAGRTLVQDGALISTTSVNTRGTIHLLNRASDTMGSVVLGAGSLTTILPELGSKETALDSQRQALVDASVEANKTRALNIAGAFDNLSALADRQDLSRIEIVTGGAITFKGGSVTAAQGGQIAASAGKQVVTEDGARLDVSGVRNVALAMESNNIKINLQGNELRDSPQNRDSEALKNKDVWIDVRALTLLPTGTGGYEGDRYYTKGGLIEVGGYLANTAHGIGEWTALGGTITLSAPEVIAQRGAVFDISGGSLDYAAGWIRSTNLVGSDGRRYSVDQAPADLHFSRFAGGFLRSHNIQGREDERLNEVWTTVFDRGRTSLRWEDGYSVGRDAGRLILAAPAAAFEASIVADTVTGERQTTKRGAATTDGYKLTQTTAAQNGTLALGRYDATGRVDLYNSDVRITANAAGGGANTVWFDAKHLSEQKLGGLDLGTRGKITVDADLTLAQGADIRLIAPVVEIDARITAQSGSFTATNVFRAANTPNDIVLAHSVWSGVSLAAGAVLDLRGAWINQALDPDARGHAFIDGGTVSLASSGDVKLARGSVIDVSSGGAMSRSAKLTGGKGGSVALRAEAIGGARNGRLTLDGDIRGYGVAGGGKLELETGGKVMIGGVAEANALRVDPALFKTGFAQYAVNGHGGVTVAAGTQVDVSMPVLTLAADAMSVPSGVAPDTALVLAMQPLYSENPMRGTLTQRKGASLTLRASPALALASDIDGATIIVETGSSLSVDPGQKIGIAALGQITIDGRLDAWGGEIAIDHLIGPNLYDQRVHNRSIWIGDNAVLDVAARAVTAINAQGRSYGIVRNGGMIAIGGNADVEKGSETLLPDSFVVIRAGAVLDASGAQAVIDIPEGGLGKTSLPLNVASHGGTISLQSANGLVIDGTLRAAAGGEGAAGGTLTVALTAPRYSLGANPDAAVLTPREIAIVMTQGGHTISDGMQPGDAGLAYGKARLGVDQIATGGFGNLALLAGGLVTFADGVDLSLSQSLRIHGAIGLAEGSLASARVKFAAPYVLLAHVPLAGGYSGPDVVTPGLLTETPSRNYDGANLGITADLIEVRGGTHFAGLQGVTYEAGDVAYARGGFRHVALTSRGDIRLFSNNGAVVPGVGGGLTALLSAPQDMTITAAQIYPASGVRARIEATNTLSLARMPGTDPAVPYSVFGDIMLEAAVVNQGGVVRAPLGRVAVGRDGTSDGAVTASQTNLLSGSITSVSAAGLVLPYGGTIDGLTYKVNGNEIALRDAIGADNRGTLTRGVSLRGIAVDVDQGAVIDLSGGGTLLGAGFFSGRGGSVNILTTPLANANPAFGYSSAGNKVYAIVPGFNGYAPGALANDSAGTPAIGQQVTVPAGVPGLPAGTYTLLPSNYAMIPGAFRVEVGQGVTIDRAPVRTEIGTYVATGHLGVANTGIRAALPNQLLITPGDKVRTHSAFNEMDYNSFVVADAARRSYTRGMITSDAKMLELWLSPSAGMSGTPALIFDGKALFAPEAGSKGYSGTLSVRTENNRGIEILAVGQAPVSSAAGVAVYADQLNAFGAARMTIGGGMTSGGTAGGNTIAFGLDMSNNVTLRTGAVLSAAEVFLIASQASFLSPGSITIEQGATINTLGRGAVPFDSSNGIIYAPSEQSVFAVSNGWVNLLAPSSASTAGGGSVAIDIGGCVAGSICGGETALYSEGTIGAATNAAFTLRDNLRYGTRNLVLGVSAVNLGSAETLAAAGAAGQLPPGMALNQTVLANLLRGNTRIGAPALEALVLNARESINIFGVVDLNTLNPVTGKSSLDRLVFGAPAIYGYGAAGDKGTITTGEFIWSGAVQDTKYGIALPGSSQPQLPGAPVLGRLGSGTLDIVADRILLGYAPNSRPNPYISADRLALGFSGVNFIASESVSSSGKGSLAVYHAQGSYQPGTGYAFSGGDLTIRTAMVTGAAGSFSDIKVGGAIVIAGNGRSARTSGDALGAELKISGQRITLDTAVVMPSGRLTLNAIDDLVLTDNARIDMAGREVTMFDVRKYSWGGDVVLGSSDGNIAMGAGASIDLSARYNRAGTLQVAALGAAGHVDLAGSIHGSASGVYDAGGTYVPYEAAEISLRAQTLADFAGLNARLNAGEVFGARRFQIKQGSLTIGDEVKARQVEIVLDGGSLTVNGRIDSSGFSVGGIRLAALGDLVINGTLDAHGTGLRVDSYGKVIDSPNRAIVDLTTREGRLTLAAGARIDLRAGTNAANNDGRARGTLTLNAPRIGADDVAIDVNGHPAIAGAKSIAVNAFRSYDDAPLAAVPDVNGGRPQLISQAYLDAIDGQSRTFINAALGNGALAARLSGLGSYHLRPGVEIVGKVSAENPNGDLTVVGDIDLSNHRYGPQSNILDANLRGFGEPGALVFRAAGNLNIHGSINDGFAPPPVTPDDNGWQLIEGRDPSNPDPDKAKGLTPFGGDIVVPINGVNLEAGTEFPAGVTLNYDIKVQGRALPAGTILPVQVTLTGALSLPAGTVLAAEVIAADGTVYAAGTVLPNSMTLNAGSRLGPGFALRGEAAVAAFIWPKGVKLPVAMTISERITLAQGSLIPSMTKVELLGDQPVNLRPGGAGRNWAAAPMLREGSTSWDLTLTAGADLGSVDVRARNVKGKGDIVLADTHHGVNTTSKTTTVFIGEMVFTQYGVDNYTLDQNDLGKPIDEVAQRLGYSSGADLCRDDPAVCAPAPRKLSEQGSLDWFGDTSWAGRSVEDFERETGMVGWCNYGPYCEGGGREETTTTYAYKHGTPGYSVIRTGTGDLAVVAGRDVRMMSMFGVYTAGTNSLLAGGATANAPYDLKRGYTGSSLLGPVQADGKYDAALGAYRAWYPDHGGNVLIDAGRDVIGDSFGAEAWSGIPLDPSSSQQAPAGFASAAVSNWLWRQGSGGTAGVGDIATSWWINFGTYANPIEGPLAAPRFVGFTGIGTLGGGDLTVRAGGNAGIVDGRGDPVYRSQGDRAPRSQGLNLAVGSTGRVVNGDLVLTGGGDLTLRTGGSLNPNLLATTTDGRNQQLDLNGALVNLRGTLQISTAAMGGIDLGTAGSGYGGNGGGILPGNPFVASGGQSAGGLVLMLGDAVANVDTRGALVLGGAGDPGRVRAINSTPFTYGGQAQSGGGASWFSLWTDRTAINLFSAGGDLVPTLMPGARDVGSNAGFDWIGDNTDYRHGNMIYPSIFRAVAPAGDIKFGAGKTNIQDNAPISTGILLAPSKRGLLELLAGDSIYAGGYSIAMSGSDAVLPSPFSTAFQATVSGRLVHNLSSDGMQRQEVAGYALPLFAFGPNTPTTSGLHVGSNDPARIYAGGSIVNLTFGSVRPVTQILPYGSARSYGTWYEAATPVWMRAGHDIIAPELLAMHNNATDLSMIEAGHDVIYANAQVAGPGTLVISASRNIRQDDKGSVTSLGAVVRGDTRHGAGIFMQAGIGNTSPDYARLAALYLDPANLAVTGTPLADQPGKVAKTYEQELAAWLKDRYGFDGTDEERRAYFASLAQEQQAIFLRRVYFAELKEAGREYNDANGPRRGSYLRGTRIIAAFLPETDADGNAIARSGDIVMFGGSGVRTQFGGDIEMLTPGGQTIIGVEGQLVPASAGVVTQGAGNISMYAKGSIPLGLSRVMTTFGGNVLAWTATGDINAGRGAKTTVLYTPPKRATDLYGNVTLSPQVPSSGAGIATLNPIPEVPAGDIDLIAPLGTIDAGEAGIRVSGNVNLAALQVLNAANIQVQGTATGIPTVQAPSISSALSSSNATAATQQTTPPTQSGNAQPSVIIVEVLGYGGGGGTESDEEKQRQRDERRGALVPPVRSVYNERSAVQIAGYGVLSEAEARVLTKEEQAALERP
ncbi:filamentous hemagglutinin N-terminal domain-containing protein [Rhodopseudomonas boonkerdii]|nr:filamentous hemagglutinin N-terminal domain-containing protein [Rhodopseudomonas boonkerdii]